VIKRYLRVLSRVIPYVGMTLSILVLLLFVPRLPKYPVVDADLHENADVCVVASSFYAGAGEFGAIIQSLGDRVVVLSQHDPLQNIKLTEKLIEEGRCGLVVVRGEVATALVTSHPTTASVIALSPWFLPYKEAVSSTISNAVAVFGSKDIGLVRFFAKTMFNRWKEVHGTYSTLPYQPQTLELISGAVPHSYVPAYILFGVNAAAVAVLLLSLTYLVPPGGDDGVKISWSWIFLALYPVVGLFAVLGYRLGWEPYGVYGGWFWLLMGIGLSLLALFHIRFDIREIGVGVLFSIILMPLALWMLRWCGVFPYLDRSKLVYGVLLAIIYVPWFVYVSAVVRMLMRYPMSALAVWPIGILGWLPVVSTAFASGMLPVWHVFFFGWQMIVGVLIAGLMALPVVRRHAIWGGVLVAMLWGVIVAGVLPPV